MNIKHDQFTKRVEAKLQEWCESEVARMTSDDKPTKTIEPEVQFFTIYGVGNKTSLMHFEDKGDAENYVAASSPSIGLQVFPINVLKKQHDDIN